MSSVPGRLSGPVVPGGLSSLRNVVARWRNRLVANPRFQTFAATFPLTRPVARAQSEALFDLCAGFVYAQVLSACVTLDLFRRLEPGPLPARAIAAATGLPAERALRLLKAAAALKLVEPRGTDADGEPLYGLAMLGAALLGNPGVGAMIAHHHLFYRDLADPVALLRGDVEPTALGQFWAYAGRKHPDAAADGAVAAYSELMSASQQLVCADILAAYDFARHRHIVDLAGGEGTFLAFLARHVAGPRLTLFDLPPVAERARARFLAAGLGDRADAIGGDMHRDPLPADVDLVTLVRVVHDHDDEAVMALFRRLRATMAPGATLLIAEPMAGLPGTGRMADAYFGFYLLAMGSGRARTPAELTAMLDSAGFLGIRRLKTRRPLLTAAIAAKV